VLPLPELSAGIESSIEHRSDDPHAVARGPRSVSNRASSRAQLDDESAGAANGIGLMVGLLEFEQIAARGLNLRIRSLQRLDIELVFLPVPGRGVFVATRHAIAGGAGCGLDIGEEENIR
jgi:hypothetical protein